MKLPVTSSGLKSIFLLAILFFGAGLVYMLDTKDFSLAPVYTDMIGTATFDNIRVQARVDFFIKSVLLFLVSGIIAVLIQFCIIRAFGKEKFNAQINRLALISFLFLFQQVLIGEQGYFFIVFFITVVCLNITISKLKFFYGNLELATLGIGLLLTMLLCSLRWQVELLFLLEVAGLLSLKYSHKRAQTDESIFAFKKNGLILLTASTLVFIAFFILLKLRVDLFDLIRHIYREKAFSPALMLILVLPVIAVIPVYILLKIKCHTANTCVFGWISFSLCFIVTQFANNYFPVLLMMLVFLMRAIVIQKRKVIGYYLLAADILLCLALFYFLNIFSFSKIADLNWLLLPSLFILISFFRINVLSKNVRIESYKYTVVKVSTPLLLFLSQEIFMVLNQYHIFLGMWGYIYVLLCAYAMILLTVFLWRPQSLKAVFSVVFVIGIAGIAIYNSYNTVWMGGPHFFEDASSAVAIKRMYNNSEIPVFEHFSPHNLNDFITGYFYVILNNDLSFGYKIYSCFYGLFFLLYYYMLSKLFNSKIIGFMWTLFSGMLVIMLPMYHAIALLAFFNLNWYFTNKYTFLRLVISSVLFLFTVFFRADTGIAVLISVIVVTPLLVRQNKHGLKKLKLLAITCGAFFLIIALVVLNKVGYKQVLNNVQMILYYFNSSQSWGYSQLARIYDFKFRIHYFVFPVMIIAGLLYALLPSRKGAKSFTFLNLSLIYFSVYYLVNFQRGLIRHSFFEIRDINISSYVYFIIGLLGLLLFLQNEGRVKMMWIFLLSVSCSIWVFKFPIVAGNRSLYTAAIDRIGTGTNLPFAPNKIKRFDLEKLSQVKPGDYQVFLYSIIDQLQNVYKSGKNRDQIFLGMKIYSPPHLFLKRSQMSANYFPDISKLVNNGTIDGPVDEVCYQPMLHYFINRKSIHFFNQGVHFYHTKKLQQQYINDLVTSGCKYVFVNNLSFNGAADYLDDVPHSIRHYYILQHIYTHYKPAVILDMKTLWVKDSVPINTKPLFQLTSAVSDSLYQFPKPLSVKGKKVLLTIFSHKDINGEAVLVNGKVSLRASFTNRQEHTAFVLVERDLDTISNILLPVTADSISVAAYDYFPDKFTNIPLSYNLKQLPYVLAQSPTFKKGGQPLMMDKKKAQSAEFFLNNELESKGCGLWLKLSNNATADKPVVLQYYKGARFLGEYNFIGKPGKQIAYLLQVASQPNWNLLKPDKIKIITSSDLSVDGVHLITKDELSY